jgi:arabinofuranosyltransferase
VRGRGALLLIAVALAAALGLFVQRQGLIAGTVGFGSFPLDDSWIHFQFARNLASGHGFAYNPDVPVAGSTAPLWTLLLAGFFKLGGAHPALAKVAGIVAALAAAWLARELAQVWTGDTTLGLTAALATAWSAPVIWGALSGMEVTLAAALVMGALVAHTAGRVVLTSALLGLAALTRPESVLLIPLVWLGGSLTLARTAIVWGVPSALLGPWVVFNLRTAGTPLPATAAAKIEGGLVGFLSGAAEPLATTLLWRPWQFEREWIAWLASVNVLLPVLILPGLFTLWRRGGRFWAWPAAIVVAHPIGMALLAPYRGPGFQEGRYSIHLLPLCVVVAVSALAPLAWAARLHPMWGRLACAILLAASFSPLAAGATRYAWAVQNIDAMQVSLGRWVAVETPAEARLALNDVGAIAYVSRREVIDVMGLVTPAIIPYRREGEAGVLRYLERTCPDYLIVFPAWFPALSARHDLFTPVRRVKLEHNEVAGADEMVVYRTAWNRWREPRQPCPPPAGSAGHPAGREVLSRGRADSPFAEPSSGR